MNGYEIILEDGLDVGTNKGGYNVMRLGSNVGEIMIIRLGIKYLLSLWFSEITALVSFYGSFIVINMNWFLEGLKDCQIVSIKLSCWWYTTPNQRLFL